VLAIVAGLLLTTAATALAKPDKPAKPEEPTYQVTMGSVAEADGLATTCPGFSPTVTMGVGQKGALAVWSIRLETLIHYDGGVLTGCHGNLDPYEHLDITPYPGTNPIKIWWRFDYTRDGEVTTFFELISNPDFSANPATRWAGAVAWEDANGDGAPDRVRGPFTLRRHGPDGWQVLGEALPLEFTLTITETAG